MEAHLKTTPETRRALAEVSLGDVPADLVVRGGRLVEVHTGAVIDADVAIKGDRIAAVGDVSASVGPETEVLDATGHLLTPGFIDGHIHMGASHLTAGEFAKLVVRHGTAAACIDFKEQGLVAGLAGVRAFLEQARATPLKVLFSGFPIFALHPRFGPSDSQALLDLPETVELREWNIGLETLIEPLTTWADDARQRNLIVAGHLRGESGPSLQASVAIGVASDHECLTAEDALEKARLGLRVIARRAGGRFPDLMRAITDLGADPRCFMVCVDDAQSEMLQEYGHVDGMIREAISCGVAPIDAVRMGSLNAAEYFGIAAELGSIAPGRLAYINIVSDLERFEVLSVIAAGQVVAENDRFIATLDIPPLPAEFLDTIELAPVAADHFVISAPSDRATIRVIDQQPGAPSTEEVLVEVPVRDGAVTPDPRQDLVKICMIDRMTGSGQTGRAFLRGFGLDRGGFASTFSIRDMNLMVVGVDDDDMATAANRVIAMGGGIAVACNGRILAELAMPILGIASDLEADEVADRTRRINDAIINDLGSRSPEPVADASLATISVFIPNIRVGINGLERRGPHGLPEVVDVVVASEPDEGTRTVRSDAPDPS